MARYRIRFVVVLLLLFSFSQLFSVFPVHQAEAAAQFTFASAGDYGLNGNAKAVMNSISTSGASFALAVGDFLYTTPNPSTNEQTWCNTFHASIPNVLLEVGNHETWETNTTDGGGSINKFLQYCPFTLDSFTGTYGYRYYFDYPTISPLARFISIDPGIWNGTTSSSRLSYASGTANYAWVSSAIDSARSSGIPWVIVVMHKLCITTGQGGCEVSPTFMTMLMNKRVDLIIQAHDHIYERSKQLTCATDGTFVASCVAASGSSFVKGTGSVYVVDGTGGEGGGKTVSNGNTGYFQAYCCSTGTPLGYSMFTVSSSSIQSRFVNTGGKSYSDSFTITNTVPDIAVSANPASVGFVTGASASSTVTVSSLNGFAGIVSLSASSLPSGLVYSLSRSSLVLSSGGSASSLLSLSSSTTGTFSVTVTGTSGSITKSTTVTVVVTSPPDFSIASAPSAIIVQQGVLGPVSIGLASLNSFSGTVSLTAAESSGLLSMFLNPTNVNLASGGTASSILSVSSSTVGNFTVVLTGASGLLSHSTTVSVSVRAAPDFGISANLTNLTVPVNDLGTGTITVTSLGNFNGTISLTVSANPPGLTLTLSPATLSIGGGGVDSSTLTVTSSITGVYSVTVTGSSDTLSHSVALTVQVSDFTMTAQPSSFSFEINSTGTSTIGFSSLNGFAGTIGLSVEVSPSGAVASLNQTSVALVSGGWGSSTLTVNSSLAGVYDVTVVAVSGSVSHTITVSVGVSGTSDFTISTSPAAVAFKAGGSSTTSATVTSLSGFQGDLTISTTTSPSTGLDVSCNPSFLAISSGESVTSVCDISSSTTGVYVVTIMASNSTAIRSATITVTVSDYYISSSQSVLTILNGDSGSSIVSLNSLNGFSGSVSLNVSSDIGLSANLSAPSITLISGGTGATTLSVSSSGVGNYTVTITGTSASLSHSITITVLVVDFSVTLDTSSLTITAGQSVSSLVTITSVNGFSGTISLTSAAPFGASAALNPVTTTIVFGVSGLSILTISSAIGGTYSITVTATSGSLSHSVQLTLTVQDFSIGNSPSAIVFQSGQSANSTLSLNGLSGFIGNITIITSAPSGVNVSCPGTANIGSLDSSFTGTCNFSSSTPGVYTVTVTGASGALTHSIPVTVSVGDFSINATPTNTTIFTGSNVSVTLNLTSLGQFAGVATLTVTASSVNVTVSLTPSSVSIPSAGSATSTLTVGSNAPGNYTITAMASSGSLSHSVTILLTVNVSPPKPQYALVTSFNGQVYKYQNGTLTLIGQPVTSALRLIAWKPDGSYALIVGDSGVVIKWDGTSLTRISTTGFMSSGDDLNTIAWNPSGTFALMGGTDGDLLRWDAATQTLSKINDPNTHQIQGISWNPVTGVALFVGNGGALFSYNNGVITMFNSGTTNDLYGVAWHPSGAYALITGSGGSIVKWNGTTTTPFNTSGLYPSTTIVRYVAWNSAGTLALMTGTASGLVLSYDGTSLTVLSSGTTNGMFSLAWSGNTATLVGNSGTMITYSNGVFKTVVTGITVSLRGIAWKPS